MRRGRSLLLLVLVVLLGLGSAAWQVYKPLPAGISVAGPWRAADEVRFLADRTFLDAQEQRQSRQQIFDQAFELVAQAQRLVVLDMFLFNDFGAQGTQVLRPLSEELAQALLARMAAVPALRVIVITDPVNTVYGGRDAPALDQLAAAGAQIVTTRLARLRASNPAWSGPWALCCAWLGNSPRGGRLPNPFGGPAITLRSWLALPNFRANHRKTLVVDHGDGWRAMVLSANPHDASSAHDNVALQFSGSAALDLLAAEAAVAAFSGAPLAGLPVPPFAADTTPSARLRILSEGAIRTAVLETLNRAQAGDALDIAMFYLSERRIIEAIKRANARGVRLRLLLDPNEDAFGRKKNGVPNRPVAADLYRAGVDVRWCDTHGEQCHAKFLLHRTPDGASLILGSGNWTRRNLDDLNLEMDVQLVAPAAHPAVQDAAAWFGETWRNESGRRYSVDYARYRDDGLAHRLWYRAGEATGFSTW